MKFIQIGELTSVRKTAILRNKPKFEDSTYYFRVTTEKNLYVVIELVTIGLHEKTEKLLTPDGIMFVYLDNLTNA